MKVSIAILSVLLVAVSCSKGGTVTEVPEGGPHLNNPTDTLPPSLVISTPVPDQVVQSGSAITVSGRVTDDLGLYRGTIRITQDATGFLLREQAYEIHGMLSYSFNLAQPITVTTATDYTVTVRFEDHGSNAVSRSVKFKVNP